MQIQTHVPDLIEEYGAAMGRLELSFSRACGTGEGALLMTEQLTLDQLPGYSRTIDWNKRKLSAWREGVNGFGHQFLTCPGLSLNEHCNICGGNFFYDIEHPLHLLGFAQDLKLGLQGVFQPNILLDHTPVEACISQRNSGLVTERNQEHLVVLGKTSYRAPIVQIDDAQNLFSKKQRRTNSRPDVVLPDTLGFLELCILLGIDRHNRNPFVQNLVDDGPAHFQFF